MQTERIPHPHLCRRCLANYNATGWRFWTEASGHFLGFCYRCLRRHMRRPPEAGSSDVPKSDPTDHKWLPGDDEPDSLLTH